MLAASLLTTSVSWAQDEPTCVETAEARAEELTSDTGEARVVYGHTAAKKPLAGRFLGTAAVGRGFRFNNPYRLATPLGDTAESLSLTATYLDLALTGALGRVPGPAHGVTMHLSVALQGVGQEVLTPSYVQLWRLSPRFMVLGRGGAPIVLRPDVTFGFEGAFGALWYATAGTGITGELVGSLFYGAATRERDPTAIPVVGLQLGVFLDYEVIP